MAGRKRRDLTRESLQPMATIGDGTLKQDLLVGLQDQAEALAAEDARKANLAVEPAPELDPTEDYRKALAVTAQREARQNLPQSRLEPGEAAKYGPQGVAAANAEVEEQAARTPMQKAMKGRMMPTDERIELIIKSRAGTDVPIAATMQNAADRQEYVAKTFPTVALAQKMAGLTDDEVRASTNFALAADAARTIMQSPDPDRQTQILQTMAPAQQGLVIDILKGMQDAAQERLDMAKEDPSIMQQGLQILGIPVAQIIDSLVWLNDQAQHIVRATGVAGWQNSGGFAAAWEATENNQYIPGSIEYARETYGDMPVDIILEMRNLAEQGDANVIGTMVKKYEGNGEALRVIDVLVNSLSADQQLQDLATFIDQSNMGNTGALFSMSLGTLTADDGDEMFEWANSSIAGSITNATNVTATVAFDPTIFASKVNTALKAARYGLGAVAAAEVGERAVVLSQRLDKVFQTRAVRNYFNDVLGPQIKALSMETDVGKRAQMFNSMTAQHKKFFKPEAIAMMEKAAVYTADDALDFFQSGDNITTIFLGQTAKRSKLAQVQVPHMTLATVKFKQASMAARGATWEKMGSARWIDGVMGQGTSARIAQEIDSVIQAEAAAPAVGLTGARTAPFYAAQRVEIIKKVQDELAAHIDAGNDRAVGEFLSQFQFADGVAKRTWAGRVIGAIIRDPSMSFKGQRHIGNVPLNYAMARYGYAKEGRLNARTRLERISRLMSHRPNSNNGLYIADGRDANMVREIMLAAGINPYWANFSKYLWVHSTEAQRKVAASGIARTFGYATGMHVVDPELGIAEIGRMAESIGQRYAPDVVDIAGLRQAAKVVRRNEQNAANRASNARNKAIQKAIANGVNPATLRGLPPVPRVRSLDEIYLDLRQTALSRNPGQFIDMNGKIQNTAVFYSQNAERVHIPNLAKAEALGIRQSMLQGFLGNNIAVQTVTDFWVMATLLGPRFQMRSGIEDALLYAVTGGSWRGWRAGRLFATSVREATGQKLGVVKTSNRVAGDVVDDHMAILKNLFLPHLDADEVNAALKALEVGDRRPVIKLMNKATLRRRMMWVDELDKRNLSNIADVIRPSEKTKRYQQYIDDMVEYSDNPLDAMGEVAETSAHLLDPNMPRARAAGIEEGSYRTIYIGGKEHRIVLGDGGYTSNEFAKGFDLADTAANRAAHQEWYDNIVLAVAQDSDKGKKAVELVKRYHAALQLKTAQPAKVQAIIDELADVIRQSDTPYVERMAHGQREGAEGLARRTLDAVLAMFSDGEKFNDDLYKALVRKDPQTGAVTVAMSDNGVLRLRVEDLQAMDVKPMSVLAPKGLPVVAPDSAPFSRVVWDMTGRSLARMTREPIFLSNYFDARELLAPYEEIMAQRFGSAYAKRWAVETAERRAVEVSMNFLDNPEIRSQLAWNMRNVARFYRAAEDFNRRMVRVAKNQPLAFWKIALGWNMLDDTGFVHTDEFGDKYFVWPGVNVAFDAVNDVSSKLFGVQSLQPGAMMAFTSRVNMLTPSADPNSWTPTLSGPYSALFIKPLFRSLPALKSFEDEFFGEYSPDEELWRGVLPPHLTRALDSMITGSQGEEKRRSEQGTPFATFYRQAAQIFAYSNPNWEETTAGDPGAAQKARESIDHMALDLLLFKNVTGYLFPASVSTTPWTVTDFSRGLGVDGLREAFVQLQKQYPEDPGKAFAEWYRMNPDLSPFTVSSTNSNQEIGSYKPFKETVAFIEGNLDYVKKNPVGASFFAPTTSNAAPGESQLAAWKYIQRMGVYAPKDVDQFFNEIVTAQGYNEYMILKAQYEEAKANGDESVDKRWAAAKQDLKQRFPLLDSRVRGGLSTYERTSPGDDAITVESVREAAEYFQKAGNPLADRYLTALKVYDQAQSFQEIPANTDRYTSERAKMRNRWLKGFVPDMLNRYQDDKSFIAFMSLLTSALTF